MGNLSVITKTICRCLENSRVETSPFRHWFLQDVLPREVCSEIMSMPFAPPRIGDTKGKRETHNAVRTFFSVENRKRFRACGDLAVALQSEAAILKLEETCGINLRGSFLRIEYCQDTEGFWLEPHTDIRDKLFTMLVYLSTDPGSEKWGTDIYDENLNLAATASCAFNSGLIFIPGPNTWHGFRKRPIDGVRRSLIVNYVIDWRDRHQLSFPDQPISYPERSEAT